MRQLFNQTEKLLFKCGLILNFLQIDFLPTIEKMAYTDYFYISPAGFPSQCVVKCVGRSTAPDIKLSTSILSFKYAELNTEHKQYLTISNESNVKTSYQIVLDSTESVFKVDKNCGTLDGKEERTIVVKFVPLQAISILQKDPYPTTSTRTDILGFTRIRIHK